MTVEQAVCEQELLFIRVAHVGRGHRRLLIVDNGDGECGQWRSGIALTQPVVNALTAEWQWITEWHDDGRDERLVGTGRAPSPVQLEVGAEPIVRRSGAPTIPQAGQPDHVRGKVVVRCSGLDERNRSFKDRRMIGARLKYSREPPEYVDRGNGNRGSRAA